MVPQGVTVREGWVHISKWVKYIKLLVEGYPSTILIVQLSYNLPKQS